MDIVKHLAEEYISRTTKSKTKYIVEQQMSGYRCIAFKTGKKITLYSDTNEDITTKFTSVVTALKDSYNQDLIVDGTIVINSASDIKYYLSDIMNFNKDISMLQWEERHKYLNKLKYNSILKLVPTHLVTNKTELTKYVNFVSNLDGSIGASVKLLNSTYPDTNDTNWFVLTK